MENKPTQFNIRPARPDEAALFCGQNTVEGKPLVGRVTYVNDYPQEFTDADEFLRCVREALPYHPTTGFRYEVLTDDPEVRKAADDALYDLYGKEALRPLKDDQDLPRQGMTMEGM